MTLRYTTTLQLADILKIRNDVPSWVLYANKIEMTTPTHYYLDLDTGRIKLTSAGISMLSTNDLTAKYSYINIDMSDSYLKTVLERAEKEVDDSCNSVFINTNEDNPKLIMESEIRESNGIFNNKIITNKKPLINVKTYLDEDVSFSQTSIKVSGNTGKFFPTSGYIIIDNEVMYYSGVTVDELTGVTRGIFGTTVSNHIVGAEINTTIVFINNSSDDINWQVLEWYSGMFADKNGVISINGYRSNFVQINQDVANKVKILYYFGYNTIPNDITRLALIFAKRQLVQDNISKAMIAGRNEFRPEMFNVDVNEINRILNTYRVLPLGNT